jgi:uncharacterized protein (UPF0261 family)
MASTTVAILGTLDTKGEEFAFLKEEVERRGYRALVIDAGVIGPPHFAPDIGRDEVANAVGADVSALAAGGDRGRAVAAMARGAESVLPRLFGEGRFAAIVGMGGSAGTAIATAAMRALPLGVPKVMISTLAGGDVSGFVGTSDIVMVPTIVDCSGLNRISRRVLAAAAGAVCGMLEARRDQGTGPLLAASMFGNTTPCVDRARALFEEAGYEVLVFHATGTGGRTMERLIEAGEVAGVFDVTTTEWADELVGGVLAAGPGRLEAAARSGTPAVIAPGCLDMINFWAPETVPAKFSGRRFYPHNPNVTLMRTTPEESAELGRILADKLNLSRGPAAVYLPLRGVSAISAPGGPFHWPEADAALFDALKRDLRPEILVREIDANINDPEFADAAARALLEMLAGARAGTARSLR